MGGKPIMSTFLTAYDLIKLCVCTANPSTYIGDTVKLLCFRFNVSVCAYNMQRGLYLSWSLCACIPQGP